MALPLCLHFRQFLIAFYHFFFVSFCDFPSSNKLKLPLLHGVWLARSPDFSDIFKGNRKENFQHFPPPFP